MAGNDVNAAVFMASNYSKRGQSRKILYIYFFFEFKLANGVFSVVLPFI